MSIWKSEISLQEMTEIRHSTLTERIGIEFTEIGPDYLKGKMPVDTRTLQPLGIMHGGASCVLAETLGSVAGSHCVDRKKFVAVGLSIQTNHIKMVKTGYVWGVAKPIHLGRKTQVWDIEIKDDDKRLISVSRLTLAVIARD